MYAYVVRRFILAVLVVFLVSVIVFLMARILPGDPILMIVSRAQMGTMTTEQIEKIRHEFGLDKPMVEQYALYVNGIFHGDLGTSIYYRLPVSTLLAKRVPVTLYLGFLSLVLSTIVGILLGMISALRRGKTMDVLVTVFANVGVTIPIFWLGIMLIYAFGLKLHWLPVMGFTSPFTDLAQSTRQIIMPVICLSLFGVGAVARQTRSSMLEIVRQDYIRTAWSKGLAERTVVFRHVMKNGIIPIITLTGVHVSTILGGSVLVETVFNILGMGRLMVDGVNGLDYAVIQAVVLTIAVFVTLTNFVVDLSYGWIDPRIRVQ